MQRTLQRWRPWICPFEPLIEFVPDHSETLDIGCGGGLFLGLLAALGRIARGYGFDASGKAIAVAEAMRRRLPGGHRLRFERVDACSPWPSSHFDVVAMIDLLHHIPPAQQRSIFERGLACVRPGGRLVFKDMATRPRWRAAANQLHDLLLARQWIHHVAPEKVIAWAAEAGWRAREHLTIDRLWYRHEAILFTRAEQ
jgi:2-polyprenyl-3-methyl-5-hydroxy-6-metoxy-1,4-benzoquinol methylase